MNEVAWVFAVFGLILAGAIVATVAEIVKIGRTVASVKKHPNDAYDFFTSHPDDWTVFRVSGDAINPSQLPPADDMPGGKLLGPFRFRVPDLDNRSVTVYGHSKNSIDALQQFFLRVRVKERGQQTHAAATSDSAPGAESEATDA